MGPADRTRINVNEPYELRYWIQELGVSANALRAAVKAVGVMAADVRAYPKKKKATGTHAGSASVAGLQ
jgi:hypothetical protein